MSINNKFRPVFKTERMWAGKRCVYATLATFRHPKRGLCKLDRDQIGTVVKYYIRLGVTPDGLAAGGGMPYKRLTDAVKDWEEITAYRLADKGDQIAMSYEGRTLLGDVIRVLTDPQGDEVLEVKHFNGSIWPVMPLRDRVEVLS